MGHSAIRHKQAPQPCLCACAAAVVLAAGSLVRRTARLWPLRPAPVLRGRGAPWSAAPSLRCAGLRRRDVLSQGLPAWNPVARLGGFEYRY